MTSAPHWVAIVNPRSGGRRRPDDLERRLAGVVDRVLVSNRPGHVDALVRSCRDAEGIVVAGGDGTLFEVLQACDRSRQKIALIPAGRGNSLAKDLEIVDRDLAIRSVTDGADRAIDLLGVTLRLADGREWEGVSASNLAIGYPAEVAHNAARWRRLGACSYAIAALASPPDPFDVLLRRDDGPDTAARVTGLVISNSRYVGPFLGFPSSDLCDSLFHTIEMRAGTIGQTLHNLSALTRLGFYEPGERHVARTLSVVLDTPTRLKIDGEIRDDVQEVHVRILPSAVTLRVPVPRYE